MLILRILCSIVACDQSGSQFNFHNNNLHSSNIGQLIQNETLENRRNYRETAESSESSLGPLTVLTDKGFIEGSVQSTPEGRRYAAFQSIPYGKSPSGRRRFRAPEPVDSWSGILPTRSPPPSCLQLDFSRSFLVHGRENCLFLNVFTPKVSEDASLPVIVFMHGGGYMCGSSNIYGPAYFLNRDIVLVTINYRLGPLGFLSTGDSESSGNWGMKDAVLALKWVQNNIRAFGGDPSRVTIMGESTGASTVGLLVVSKLTHGLFHQAICQSGSAFNHFALINDTIANSKALAEDLGCPTGSSQRMMECLRSQDPNWIAGRSINTIKELLLSRLNFGPVVERNDGLAEGDEAFLEESPEVAYAQGRAKRVPMILGVNQDEGALFAGINYLIPFNLMKLNTRWNELAPYAMAYDGTRTNNTNAISASIKEFYMNGEDRLTFWNRRKWMQALGDRTIVQGVYYTMQHHFPIAPTYGYLFSYGKGMSILKRMGLSRREWGVSHADELIYMFNSSTYDAVNKESQEDYQISSFLTEVWSNFAATGKPHFPGTNGDKIRFWEPISDMNNLEVMNIGDTMKSITMPFKRRVDFWSALNLKGDQPAK